MRLFYTVTVSSERQNFNKLLLSEQNFCVLSAVRDKIRKKNVTFEPNILKYNFCIFGNWRPFLTQNSSDLPVAQTSGDWGARPPESPKTTKFTQTRSPRATPDLYERKVTSRLLAQPAIENFNFGYHRIASTYSY